MSPKLVPLVAALTLAGTANAVTINMTDFTFGSPVSANITGTGGSPTYNGSAGAFTGTLTDSAPSDSARRAVTAASAPTSFVAWCAQLTEQFNFGVNYQYSLVDGASYHFGNILNDPNNHRVTDLSKLFTAAAVNHFVFDAVGSAAFQAGIWEIIYEQDQIAGYSFASGTLLGGPSDQANQSAFTTVNGFLTTLGRYSASYHIEVLANDGQQDFLVATIPEPETWALLVGGLGAIGFVRRRRKS